MTYPDPVHDSRDDGMIEDAGSLDDAVRGLLTESDESRRAYLKESWLAAVIAHLRRARQRAGLTQDDLAERMGTRQPSIARLERAEDTTLGRLWDYLYACGEAPTALETIPVADLARFVAADPAADRTVSAVQNWLAAGEGAEPSARSPRARNVPAVRPPERVLPNGVNGRPTSGEGQRAMRQAESS